MLAACLAAFIFVGIHDVLVVLRVLPYGLVWTPHSGAHTIERYVQHYNTHQRPLVWTATADAILAKIKRLCKVICGTGQ